jgi:hypothetical protein
MISSGYVLKYIPLVSLIRLADTAEIALEITIKLNHMKTSTSIKIKSMMH